MIKILFLINTLGGGGAEKVLVNLVNNMDQSVFDITVETMFDDGINASLLNKNIHYISKKAPCPRGIAYIFRFFSEKQLYRYFIGESKYDILVAYMHGAPVKVISGCLDKSVKKIAWLHNGNPETGTFFKFWFSKNNAVESYKKCNAVVGVSKSVLNAFSGYAGINQNIFVVYNTNDTDKILKLSEEFNPYDNCKDRIHLVSVGRISSEKGFDRLLNVCIRLKSEGYNFDVTVVGTGDKEEELKKQITGKNASDYFYLAGFKSNPYPYVSNADIFICPSYQEGLSTAVTEAVILGVPCVSTDVSGAKEILGENNEYGIVTDNSETGIYAGIKKLLDNSELRDIYRNKSKERAEFFSTKNSVKQAEDLFKSLK